MSKFIREKFQKSGEYLKYDGKFIARFKHKPGAAGTFQTSLMKNFEVEEYFYLMDKKLPPLTILESRGYILPHIRKWIREGVVEQSTIDRELERAKQLVKIALES